MPCPLPEDLPHPGIKPRSPASQAVSLLSEPPGKEKVTQHGSCHTTAHRMTSSRMGGIGNLESQERPQSRKLRFRPSCQKRSQLNAVMWWGVMRDQWQAVTAKCSDVVGSSLSLQCESLSDTHLQALTVHTELNKGLSNPIEQ